MAAKKKTAKSSEPERRPPVTQVVEVVEDNDESTHTAVAEPTPGTEALEDPPVEEKQEETEGAPEETQSAREEADVDPSPSDQQKRRVLVDELFEKKSGQQSQVMPEISVHKKSPLRPIILWVIILLVATVVIGGIILAVSGKAGSLPSIMSAPTPTPTGTPTPTPTPDVSQLDRSTITIQVLNGSGTAGVAGTMKDLLEEKGYTVEDTGNADNYDYENTQILVKPEKEAFLALLTEDLKESYSLGTSGATLEDDVPYDVRIIVGKE